MDITPGRAPFSAEEDYTPLRKPKSVINNPPVAVPGYGVSSATVVAGGSLGVDTGYGYGRTVSPSKLSPFAKEFVPRFGGASSSGSGAQQQQQEQQTSSNYQSFHGQQQRYANGYPSPSQQQYGQKQLSLTASVQERLKIAGASAPSTPSGSGNGSNVAGSSGHKSNNFYQQQPHHSHNQTRYHKQQQQRHHNHNHNQQQHHHNHHQHHNSNRQNHHHHHNQHQHGHSNSGGGGGSGGGSGSSGNDMETIALDYLQTVIQCLNQNPGQFDSIATRFLTIFDGMENNQFVLSVAMEDIFQESIQNPNFRYMGAKLYNLLHMLNLKKDSLFHTLLKCKLDYHQQEVVQYMQSNQQQKVRETALFLAELYMQLRGDDSRIHLIAENIVYSLKQLLSKETADNVRCICLTLKLAGYDLTADCPNAMPEIISALDGINQQSPGKYPLAANVISLQKNNWGRKVSSNSLSDVSEDAAGVTGAKGPELRLSDEPVFYGPDGRELTAEEADFLAGGATADINVDSDKDDDVDDELGEFDAEMDEETEKAYKEFCKLNAST